MSSPRKRASLADAPGHVAQPGAIDDGHLMPTDAQDGSQLPDDLSRDRPWNSVRNIFILCAYVVDSRERTSNVILTILSLQITIVILATILLFAEPALGSAVQLGYSAAGLGTLVTIVSLIRARLRKGRRGDGDTGPRRHE